MAAIHGVGEVVLESLVSWFADKSHQTILAELLPHLNIQNPTSVPVTQLCRANFVLTGTLGVMTETKLNSWFVNFGKVTLACPRIPSYVVVGLSW